MEPEPPKPTDEANGDGGVLRPRYAIVVIVAAIGIAAGGIVAVRPYVVNWLAARTAYRNLTSPHNNVRADALHWLVNNGEDPDAQLVALLAHPSNDVQLFAVHSLSVRPAKPAVTAALLQVAERSPRDPLLCAPAVRGLTRHAETSRSSLQPVDRQIIAVVTPMLTDQSLKYEAAQVLAEYVPCDATLQKPLEPFLYDGPKHVTLAVARGCYRCDPGRRDMYFNRLVSGVVSRHPFTAERATRYLQELGQDGRDVIPFLEASRENAPINAAAIDRAIAQIEQFNRAGK